MKTSGGSRGILYFMHMLSLIREIYFGHVKVYKTACLHFTGDHWASCHLFLVLGFFWCEMKRAKSALLLQKGIAMLGASHHGSCHQPLVPRFSFHWMGQWGQCDITQSALHSHLLAEPPSCISSFKKFWYYIVEREVNYLLRINYAFSSLPPLKKSY